MNSIEAQLKEIIKKNIPKTIDVNVPFQNENATSNLLLQILRNQEEINERMKHISIKLSMLETQINCLPYGNKYHNTKWH